MRTKSISRRDFLKGAGIVLGGSVLVGTGLMAVETGPAPAPLTFTDQHYGGEGMSNKILVAYASQAGSTAGVAEAIGKSLADGGAQVDVRHVKSVTDLGPYRAVVIGSAIHSGEWLPEAVEFAERNQAALRRMPTAIFQVCMMMTSDNEQYRSMIPSWLDPIAAKLNPVAKGSFAGQIDLARYPKLSDKLGMRIFLAFIKKQAGDYRDWNAI
jgi:menaquinone-dependent protoporphyrinogen oxidase